MVEGLDGAKTWAGTWKKRVAAGKLGCGRKAVNFWRGVRVAEGAALEML